MKVKEVTDQDGELEPATLFKQINESNRNIALHFESRHDLKEKLNEGQIGQLCGEIRNRIIETTSENGGHVGPNLGVVELTVALHLVFDTPKDSFFWGVSHQGYVHKLLTGRNDKRFDKIRQSEGLSGFLSRDESQHDAFGAGHAGTALSAALGRCMAIRRKKRACGRCCRRCRLYLRNYSRGA